jgi:hypothetical protein
MLRHVTLIHEESATTSIKQKLHQGQDYEQNLKAIRHTMLKCIYITAQHEFCFFACAEKFILSVTNYRVWNAWNARDLL